MVSADTESTSSINVRWFPPPINMTYGIITAYEVQYGEYNATTEELMNGTDPIRQNVTDDNSTFVLTFKKLQKAREYGFQVRAITVAGGPYSQLAINTTFAAHKLANICLFPYDVHYCLICLCFPQLLLQGLKIQVLHLPIK